MKSTFDYLKPNSLARLAVAMLVGMGGAFSPAFALDLTPAPLYLTTSQSPLVLLTMARDHKLYYEAYNDYSDLDSDGTLDVGYKPNIDYYGYFDSNKCYDYTSGVFTPVAVTANKKCTGGNDLYWSGDFLNYVTMSRIDALRKVFYGGYRSTDSATQTILERSFIPQDAHSWGKEYLSIAYDGYDISEYTPLSVPQTGYRHLFANTTITGFGSAPLMRVLDNSRFRIWEWISIERPVADTKCATGNNVRNDCVVAASTSWSTVPASTTLGLSGLTRKVYNISGSSGHPSNQANFDILVANDATAGNLCGTDNPTTIEASGNPFAGVNGCNAAGENYMTLLAGTINVPTTATYTFAVDGDDAVDLFIDGTQVAGWYGGHGACNCETHSGSITLTAGAHTIAFRHEERTGGDSYKLKWQLSTPASAMVDYEVRVEVCKATADGDSSNNFGRESNCQSYGSGTPSYKPTGMLHKYGQDNGMFFGLLSGSYDQNTNGGILRKPIGSITNEVETTTGIFKESGSTCGTNGTEACVKGIVGTINRFRITGFDYGSHAYSCGWITTRQMNNGECEMWGNPLGEMMYEGMRYISGETTPTSAFTTSTTRDDALGLPKYTGSNAWPTLISAAATPPAGQFPKCAKPYFMLVSDVFPSFDSDSVPGTPSEFGSFSGTSSFNGNTFSATTWGQSLWNVEFGTGASKNIFIGQVGTTYDGAPTVKSASSFGNIRGLSPNEPTRQGSYSPASIAYFSHVIDINPVSGGQEIGTYSIALAAPLPKIEIAVPGGKKVIFVPFAKSVGGSSISATSGDFQPTNQIVDFYVDTIKNTSTGNADATVNAGRPYYKFRINYEDVEQGADHDMDAIATYEILLNADDTVTVNVNSDYAAGGIMQHMGYVISGTTADDTYLVVRDSDTGAGSDPDYFLDKPNTAGAALPLSDSRTFTASSSASTGTILNDPLWYAAKFGGFTDANNDNEPDSNTEWDTDLDGVPDNYFLVVNPLKMEQQMDQALSKIKDSAGTSAALSTNSFSFQSETLLFQTRFNSDGWSGELNAYDVDINSIGDIKWAAQRELAKKTAGSRVILTYDVDKTIPKGIPFRWSSMTSNGVMQTTLNKLANGSVDSLGSDRVEYLRGGQINAMRTRPNVTITTQTTDSDGNVIEIVETSPNLLGDIVNSQAQYVGRPNFGYAESSYADFSVAKKNRTEMVYVGVNDGMLHGFNATTGEELLAYVPSEMYRTRGSKQLLSKLTQPDYGKDVNPHRYYVDGTPTPADICTGLVELCASSDWKSILVGGLGAGGQGIYALDITNPANFSEANASGTNAIVKWEFLDHDHDTDSTITSGDADLGYTFSRPFVVRLCTTRDGGSTPAFPTPQVCEKSAWYVVFGNGYNNTEADGYASTTGDAALFILKADTGALEKKILVKEGNTSSPNGLSELAPIDVDGDGVVDYIYAGDLKGNLWRFDVFSDTHSNWEVGFGSSSNPDPLYVAKDQQATPVAQPITTAPDVIIHPQGGLLVTFGTGSYIDTNDPTTTQLQTMYGIWDNDAKVTGGRSNLVEQTVNTVSVFADSTTTIQEATEVTSHEYRTISTNTLDWTSKKGWFLNLPDTGERIAYNPAIKGGNLLIFTSLVPSADVCEAGGYSWDYYIDALTGGQLSWPPFVDLTSNAGARKSTIGITPPGTIITEGKGRGSVFQGGSKGELDYYKANLGKNTAGRLSWREILSD